MFNIFNKDIKNSTLKFKKVHHSTTDTIVYKTSVKVDVIYLDNIYNIHINYNYNTSHDINFVLKIFDKVYQLEIANKIIKLINKQDYKLKKYCCNIIKENLKKQETERNYEQLKNKLNIK